MLRLLHGSGAFVLDADDLAREAVVPGSAGLTGIVEVFGDVVLTPEGQLDRRKLAELVFGDERQRRRLEAILHPLIADLAACRIAAAPAGSVVVYAIPLLAETVAASGPVSERFDLIVVVEAPAAVRVERLVRSRGMSEAEAQARLAAQADDAARRAIADVVLDNSGTQEELAAQVAELWSRLQAMAVSDGPVRAPDRAAGAGERADPPDPARSTGAMPPGPPR